MTASSPLSLTNPTLTYGANIAVSSLYGGGAAMGATSFAVEDFGGDGGYFLLGGVRLSDNLRYTLSAAQMSILRYVAGAAGGSERLEVQDLVGATWSAPSYSTVASVAPAPTLTSQNVSVDEGQTIAVSTLIKSIVNPTGTSTTEYAGGKLILGGVTLTAGKTYDFTAAQFAQLEFVAGATVGADTLTLQSYNGSTWSNAVTATVTIDPPPTVTVNNQIVGPGQSVWGQNFIAGVSDAAGYGASEVLTGTTLSVKKGTLVALIGANGAGKTTTMRAISGSLKPGRGRVVLDGQEVQGLDASRIARLGLAHAPEGRKVFGPLSVEDNLLLGAYSRLPRFFGFRTKAQADLNRVDDLFPRLRDRARQASGTLSGGEQQMLAIGRALMARPKVMLLDEPSMGLAPVIVQEVFRTIRRLKEEGITLLLVEQFAKSALEVADYAYVMEHGRIAVEGTPDELSRNERVIAAYLG